MTTSKLIYPRRSPGLFRKAETANPRAGQPTPARALAEQVVRATADQKAMLQAIVVSKAKRNTKPVLQPTPKAGKLDRYKAGQAAYMREYRARIKAKG